MGFRAEEFPVMGFRAEEFPVVGFRAVGFLSGPFLVENFLLLSVRFNKIDFL
jgi:hypothetical protein